MKRRYADTGVAGREGDFRIELDGRPVMTPARHPLRVPSKPLGDAIAGEWACQGDRIDPLTMPMMRLASTAIDRVAPEPARVIAGLLAWGMSDLVCFRADHPVELVSRQVACWQPLVDWIAAEHGAALAVTTGIMPLEQPPESINAFRSVVEDLDSFHLVAIHSIASATGSLVIALALLAGRLGAGEAFRAGSLDDLWSLEVWGDDAEARRRLDVRQTDICKAERFLRLLRQQA